MNSYEQLWKSENSYRQWAAYMFFVVVCSNVVWICRSRISYPKNLSPFRPVGRRNNSNLCMSRSSPQGEHFTTSLPTSRVNEPCHAVASSPFSSKEIFPAQLYRMLSTLTAACSYLHTSTVCRSRRPAGFPWNVPCREIYKCPIYIALYSRFCSTFNPSVGETSSAYIAVFPPEAGISAAKNSPNCCDKCVA